MRQNIIQTNTDVARIKTVLFDGDPPDLPLVERVRNLETFIKGIQFWFRTIAVALVIQTITFGVAAAVYFVRLLPVLEKIAQNNP